MVLITLGFTGASRCLISKPDDVLGPAFDDFFVAELDGVLDVQQRGHEPNRQVGPACRTDPGTASCSVGPNRSLPSVTCPSRALRSKAGAWAVSICFQGIRHVNKTMGPPINHMIQTGSKEVIRAHRVLATSLRNQPQ